MGAKCLLPPGPPQPGQVAVPHPPPSAPRTLARCHLLPPAVAEGLLVVRLQEGRSWGLCRGQSQVQVGGPAVLCLL